MEVILIVLIVGLLAVMAIERKNRRKQKARGIRILWSVDDDTMTEIVSNKLLIGMQQVCTRGGVLEVNDLVVVWARNFLDHDVFYGSVKKNIRDGVRYFYLLDRKHKESAKQLLAKLYDDIEEKKVVNESIDFVFLDHALTMNNFVLMSPSTSRECFYSSLIYHDRPVGWFKQSPMRAKAFKILVREILVSLANAQKDGHEGKIGEHLSIEDQVMDFSAALVDEGKLEDEFPVGAILKSAYIDSETLGKLHVLSEYKELTKPSSGHAKGTRR